MDFTVTPWLIMFASVRRKGNFSYETTKKQDSTTTYYPINSHIFAAFIACLLSRKLIDVWKLFFYRYFYPHDICTRYSKNYLQLVAAEMSGRKTKSYIEPSSCLIFVSWLHFSRPVAVNWVIFIFIVAWQGDLDLEKLRINVKSLE